MEVRVPTSEKKTKINCNSPKQSGKQRAPPTNLNPWACFSFPMGSNLCARVKYETLAASRACVVTPVDEKVLTVVPTVPTSLFLRRPI